MAAVPDRVRDQGHPRSHHSSNTKGKEEWKRKVGEHACAHLKTLRDFFYIDDRPLAATIFYFPPTAMQGDVENVLKLILDGMEKIVYHLTGCWSGLWRRSSSRALSGCSTPLRPRSNRRSKPSHP